MSRILAVSTDFSFLTQLSDCVNDLRDSPELTLAGDVVTAGLELQSKTFDCCLIDSQLALLESDSPETTHGVKLAMLLEQRHPKLPIFLLSNLGERSDRKLLGANLNSVFALNRPRTQDEYRALASKLSSSESIFSEYTDRRELVIFDSSSNVLEAHGSPDASQRASLNATLRFNSKQIGQAFMEDPPTSIVATDDDATLNLAFGRETHVLDLHERKSAKRNVLSPELLHAAVPKESSESRGLS